MFVTGGEFVRLLAAANSGDAGSFELLWRDLHPALTRYLRVMVGEQAEAIAAQAWDDITLGMGSFHGDETDWRRWAFAIARRHALTANGSRATAFDPEAAGTRRARPYSLSGDTVLQDVVTTIALDLVAELPSLQAEVLMLRAAGGLSLDDTAHLVLRSRRVVRMAGYSGAAGVAASRAWPDRPGAVQQATVEVTHDDVPAGGAWRFEALLAGVPVATPPTEEDLRLADVIAALSAAPTVAELREFTVAQAAYERNVLAEPAEAWAPPARATSWLAARLAGAAAATAIGLGAATVAAYAGVLPAPLQDVAHHLINAPSPAPNSAPNQPPGQPETSTGVPSAPEAANPAPAPSASPSPTKRGRPAVPAPVPQASFVPVVTPGTSIGVPSPDLTATPTPTPTDPGTPSAEPTTPPPTSDTPMPTPTPASSSPGHGRSSASPPRGRPSTPPGKVREPKNP